jgi:putative glutamine amidotransferase
VSGSPPPRIGITAYREVTDWGPWTERADLLPSTYADAVAAAGAVPVLLPLVSATVERGVETALDGIHALVLSGGPDVDPSLYGRERGPETDEPRADRDAWESALAREAMRRGMPLLGICRGLQLLNVALGGTLIQHLPDAIGHDRHRPVVGEFAVHDVRTAPGSRAAGILGARSETQSHHHQAIEGLGDGLVATAWADDDTIEAVEAPGCAGWMVAVQWHPEEADGEPLFEALTKAALSYRDLGAEPVAAGAA